MIEHSYAQILQRYLISTGVMSSPTPAGQIWPLYINNLPETPGQAGAVYNTTGTQDGRTHKDGKKLIHPGYQILLRGQKDAVVSLKAYQIEEEIDAILRKQVTVDAKTYLIQSVTRTTPLIPIGAVEGGLLLYSLNGLLTVSEVS